MNSKLRKLTISITLALAVIAGGFWTFELYQQSQSVRWTFHGFEVLTIILFAVCACVGWVMIIQADMRVDEYTRCRKCRHILNGLSEPRCPECGEPI